MTTSPLVLADETQGHKSCWTCPQTIPYQQGWCASCWHELGPDRQGLVLTATAVRDKTLQGRVYSAVCDSLREERRPKAPKYVPRLVPQAKGSRPKIDLSSLEIKL